MSSESSMLLNELKALLPNVTFEAGTTFSWSPHQQTILHEAKRLQDTTGSWSLLHETSHAILEHSSYRTDFELLTLEVAAWQEAKKLGQKFNIPIDENYIQDCLDTYRDWLHRRSMCPTCGAVGLQHTASEYRCHNCHTTWQVSTARFCRAYRRKQLSTKQKSPDPVMNQTTFREKL